MINLILVSFVISCKHVYKSGHFFLHFQALGAFRQNCFYTDHRRPWLVDKGFDLSLFQTKKLYIYQVLLSSNKPAIFILAGNFVRKSNRMSLLVEWLKFFWIFCDILKFSNGNGNIIIKFGWLLKWPGNILKNDSSSWKSNCKVDI